MYGMVNRSVEELITSVHGEATWLAVKRRAGVADEAFISHVGYPDDITYRLVAAASDVLGIPPDDILRAFGEHWVLHTAAKGYAHFLRAGGNAIDEFLCHLPHLHDRIVLVYPKLIPPRFEVTDRMSRSLHLHYYTHRPGLTAFAEGLIIGLGKLFGTPTRVTLLQSKTAGGDHDEFLVEW